MTLFKILKSAFTPLRRVSPSEASVRLKSGNAVLIDVREPNECADGTIHSAVLLPLSDLNGSRTRWKPFLAALDGREMFLYCVSGMRSCVAGQILASEGFRVMNAGGFQDLVKAGWKTVLPSAAMNETASIPSPSIPKRK